MSRENFERSGWGRASDGSPLSLGGLRRGIPKAAVDQMRKAFARGENTPTAENKEGKLPTYQEAWSGMTPEEQSTHGSYEGFVQSAEDWWAQQGEKGLGGSAGSPIELAGATSWLKKILRKLKGPRT